MQQIVVVYLTFVSTLATFIQARVHLPTLIRRLVPASFVFLTIGSSRFVVEEVTY